MDLWVALVSWRTGEYGGTLFRFAIKADTKESAENMVKEDMDKRYQSGHYNFTVSPMFDDDNSDISLISEQDD